MAREYGRIATGFWNSKDIRGLSDQGKLLASYLLTGPHSNMVGAYLLPDAYIADDMGWTPAMVSKALKELFDHRFAKRFADGRHIVICKFLDWNPIENPNVAKAALKQLEQLPFDRALQHVLDGLKQYEKHFPNGFGTVSEQFRNIEPEPEPEPEPEQEPEQKQELRAADASQSVQGKEFKLEAEIPEFLIRPRPKKAEGFVIPPWVPAEPWAGYVEMRKKIKFPLTDYAMKLAIGKLDELRGQGHAPAAVLEHCILKNYRGIFPPPAGSVAASAANGSAAIPSNLEALQAAEEALQRQNREEDHVH